ncbi:unnamed protein product [Arctogadus glacialis]
MAEENPQFKSFLTCSVCTEIFKDPVSLGCHHSFCSSCLQDFWAQAKNKNCPVCKKKSSKDAIVSSFFNFFIKELADSYAGRQRSAPSDEAQVDKGGRHQELKQKLRPDLTAQQNRRRHQELEETYEARALQLKRQRVNIERGIRAGFEKLHLFLRNEEEATVVALREEENDCLSTLSACKRSPTRARALLFGSDTQLLPILLLHEAKYLGNLAHRVWEEMGQRTTFSPVILDPNTADSRLSLSDDLTSVRCSDVIKNVPNNPERFSKYPDVLGSDCLSSGEHCWEVEVGDHPIWRIGVAIDGKYTQGTGETLTLKRTPERIRVQLDYDGGELSFYDPEDMTLIYTHQPTFADNTYPWFSVGPAGLARTKDVRVCGVSSRTQL